MQFSLGSNEFIELNKLLKILKLVGSGGESNVRISLGEIKVNDKIETQKRKKIRIGDIIEIDGQKIEVVN
jgi:ribosome-associated protein